MHAIADGLINLCACPPALTGSPDPITPSDHEVSWVTVRGMAPEIGASPGAELDMRMISFLNGCAVAMQLIQPMRPENDLSSYVENNLPCSIEHGIHEKLEAARAVFNESLGDTRQAVDVAARSSVPVFSMCTHTHS